MSGYDPEFLGENFKIDIPWINHEVFADVLKRDELRKSYIADYLHYSVVMSKMNRQAYMSVCNLDQTQYRSVSGRNWFRDARIGFENQLDNRYYKGTANLWDRGHLTRRTAVTWGASDHIARKASNDSCSYANACLQHRNFNQDEWRIPEKLAERFDRDLNGRLSIMTGPLFTENDRWFGPANMMSPPVESLPVFGRSSTTSTRRKPKRPAKRSSAAKPTGFTRTTCQCTTWRVMKASKLTPFKSQFRNWQISRASSSPNPSITPIRSGTICGTAATSQSLNATKSRSLTRAKALGKIGRATSSTNATTSQNTASNGCPSDANSANCPRHVNSARQSSTCLW